MFRRIGISVLFGLLVSAGQILLADLPTEIAADNPIGWWRFEDASSANGATASDSVGANHGAYSGDVQHLFGIAGQSARFDGDQDSVSIGSLGALPTEGSVEMWLYAEQIASFRNPFTTGQLGPPTDVGNNAIRIETSGTSTLYHVIGNGSASIDLANISTSFTTNEWHHLVLTWDVGAQTVNAYLNNQHVVVNEMVTLFPANMSDVRIGLGWQNLAQRSWLGRIDEVAIYDKQLSAARVDAHFGAVPEPSTAGILSILFGVAWLRRSRRNGS